MNYQSFNEIFSNLENVHLLEDRNIYVLLLGDKDWLAENDPKYRLNSSEPRIEQHIGIAEHVRMDDGSYTEISELELDSFNLLEEVLDQINFNGTYAQYKELRKIVKSRTVRDGEITCLVLYFFVDDLLKILHSNNPWVRLAGKDENDPQYDEVLAHIEEYRKELDSETIR